MGVSPPVLSLTTCSLKSIALLTGQHTKKCPTSMSYIVSNQLPFPYTVAKSYRKRGFNAFPCNFQPLRCFSPITSLNFRAEAVAMLLPALADFKHAILV